jgi:hypothetical protein
MRSVIRFSNARNIRSAEIHRQLVEVYGKGVLNEENVRWVVSQNEAWCGRSSIRFMTMHEHRIQKKR